MPGEGRFYYASTKQGRFYAKLITCWLVSHLATELLVLSETINVEIFLQKQRLSKPSLNNQGVSS